MENLSASLTGVYRFADVPVRIISRYQNVHRLCRAYACGDDPVHEITTEDADLAKERSFAEAAAEMRGEVNGISDGHLETLAVYRKLAEALADDGVILFHGSAVAVDGKAYLFAAKSGVGKSTHTRLWRELLGERAVMINDDKPLIRPGSGVSLIYGTPWDGKHRLSTNTSVPLKAICLLNRGTENRIEKITPRAAFPKLLEQTYRPADPGKLLRVLAALELLTRSVEFYSLSCNMEPEAAAVSYEGMRDRNGADAPKDAH